MDQPGDTLRKAYLAAMQRHFPFEKNIHTPREFYQHPQFNTWMELIKNQNQRDILAYAHEIIDHGYHPGLLISDGGWQKCQGTWEFIPEKFPDPKAMFDELHQLGFQVLIWVSPFICPDMVGGGEWTAFVYGKHEEELFIRMAQTSALFPMMQFSSLPWRHLSEKAVRLCKEMAELHEQLYPEIEQILSETEKTGEPILRSMEYQFPGFGHEQINDQYLLGDRILVAPQEILPWYRRID